MYIKKYSYICNLSSYSEKKCDLYSKLSANIQNNEKDSFTDKDETKAKQKNLIKGLFLYATEKKKVQE